MFVRFVKLVQIDFLFTKYTVSLKNGILVLTIFQEVSDFDQSDSTQGQIARFQINRAKFAVAEF